MMKNPVEKIFELNKPFVYFHTHIVDQLTLDEALTVGKSLEVDMSVGGDGQIFIGHPLSFYEFKKLPPPDNLDFDQVIHKVEEADLYLVLDCKDERAIERAKEIVLKKGADKCLFHSWIDGLLFKPYPPEITVEPHWPYEDLPTDKVLELRRETGVPLIASCRGLTQARLEAEGEAIADQIINVAKGRIACINFNLPESELPPKAIIDRLLNENILTWVNIDKNDQGQLPKVYLGMSDHLEKVSDPKDFR